MMKKYEISGSVGGAGEGNLIPYERQNIILEQLEKTEVVSLSQLCEILKGTSESTVRRDLQQLAKDGKIEVLRGGAARLVDGSFDTPVASRKVIHEHEKELIAETAAALVRDGDVIYLDVGTTTIRMVKYLKKKKVRIVTTDARIVSEIMGTNLDCVLVGGDIIKETASLVGPMTDNVLKTLFFNKAFIGAFGFDVESGYNCPDFREYNKKKIVQANSKEVYVLADSSKEGKRSMCKFYGLDECILITDAESEFVRKNTKYIIAGKGEVKNVDKSVRP